MILHERGTTDSRYEFFYIVYLEQKVVLWRSGTGRGVRVDASLGAHERI